MITKEQKMNLYTDLLTALNRQGIDYDQSDNFMMIALDNGKTLEVWQDYYTGGTYTYDYSDNYTSYSNIGCPDFDNVEDAIEWAVN